MKTNSYYQEFDIRETAVERLSQKIAQNKAKFGFKRKFEAVLGILFFGMVIIPTIIGTLVQSGHLAPFTPSFIEAKQEPAVEQPREPVESPVSPPITVQGVNVATEGNPVKIGASAQQQEYIDYAWKISGNDDPYDKWFIWMMEAESGAWSPTKQSSVAGEKSFGFCQINQRWHPEIIADPKFWNNWEWQLDRCYQMWEGVKGHRSGTFKALKSDSLMNQAQNNIIFK